MLKFLCLLQYNFTYCAMFWFQPDPHNDNQILIPQTRFCESKNMWYFGGFLYAIKGRKIPILLKFCCFTQTFHFWKMLAIMKDAWCLKNAKPITSSRCLLPHLTHLELLHWGSIQSCNIQPKGLNKFI